MYKIKVRTVNGEYRTLAKSRSLAYAKRIARLEAAKELEVFMGDFELFNGKKIVKYGSIITSRIKWRTIK